MNTPVPQTEADLAAQAMATVRAYHEMDEAIRQWLDEQTADRSFTRYDKMILLQMKIEADRRGVTIIDLPDDYMDAFDRRLRHYDRLLQIYDHAYRVGRSLT
jgi:hypothetical protein